MRDPTLEENAVPLHLGSQRESPDNPPDGGHRAWMAGKDALIRTSGRN